MIKRWRIVVPAVLALAFGPRPVAAQTLPDAVRKGDLAAVKQILASDPSRLEAPGENGQTPLILSILSRQEAVFAFLLEAGADIRRGDARGLTALDYAAYFGRENEVERLLGRGADANGRGNVMGATPLYSAVLGGHEKAAARLLRAGARTDVGDAGGRVPLLIAAEGGRADIVGLLLAAGARADAADRRGCTALHLACLSGQKEAVEALIAGGSPLEARSIYGNTPLGVAVREGLAEIAGILRAAGAKDVPAAPIPAGDYLGQKAPGRKPVLFAPGVVSTERGELNSVFTPSGSEFYFTVRGPSGRWTIMVMSRDGSRWTAPRPASFSGTYSDVDLFLSPDGRTLVFSSNRPPSGTGEAKKDFDVWAVERAGEGWSAPARLGPPVSSEADEFYPVLTRDGTLYFQSTRPDTLGGRDIYRARRKESAYREAENVGAPVNGPGFEGDCLVAPDESFLIISVERPGGYGQGDLHISFRRSDGTWTVPLNMGPDVNTEANENCAILSPDGRYLFFTRADDVWWVEAGIIEDLRRKEMGR